VVETRLSALNKESQDEELFRVGWLAPVDHNFGSLGPCLKKKQSSAVSDNDGFT
jgi:hypothetical protein